MKSWEIHLTETMIEKAMHAGSTVVCGNCPNEITKNSLSYAMNMKTEIMYCCEECALEEGTIQEEAVEPVIPFPHSGRYWWDK